MNRIPLIIFLLLSLATSCDQVSSMLQGEKEDPNLIKSYYDNGALKAEIRIDEQKERHGVTRQYYPNGKVKSEIEYDHGNKLNAVQYYETGKKQMEFQYLDGMKHGKRVKYWPNGNVSSELEYDKDRPGKGLIEYNKRGERLTKYPELVVKQVDRLESHGEYWIEAYFTSNPGRGTYYLGSLDNGFLPIGLEKLKKVDGKGRIVFRPIPGTFMMEKINIVASYKTGYGNPYIVEESVNMAFDY